MKIKFIFPLLFGALFFSACDEDFFEATVNVDVPEHTPALAITAEILAGDTTLVAYVSNSVGILENGQPPIIEDAKVELLKDGQPYAELPYLGLNEKFYALEVEEPFSFEPANYELRVSAAGFAPITSTQVMPDVVEIISVEYDPEGAINSDGDRVDEFSIEFQDPAGEANFYRLQIWVEDSQFGGGYMLYLDNLQPLGQFYDGNLYFKDSTIDGKKYEIKVGSYPQYGGGQTRYRVELFSITEDQFLFTRSASLSAENNDNPFAEPVIVHNNIEGGYGIFSLGTKDVEYVEP